MKRARSGASVAMEHPARDDPDRIAQLPIEPEDDLYFRAFYAPRVYTVPEALAMHREVMQPAIFNAPDADVILRLDLNMKLAAKNRYVKPDTKVIPIPHPFPFKEESRGVAAFALEQEQIAAANVAGGQDLVRSILKGDVSLEDIDYAVCHLDALKILAPLRGLLKDRYPTIEYGCIGIDLGVLTRHFKTGLKYTIQRDARNDEFGVCKVVVGKLDMPDEHIEAYIGDPGADSVYKRGAYVVAISNVSTNAMCRRSED